MSIDPIADMLTILRNGQTARLTTVSIPKSKFKIAILDYLAKYGYIESYTTDERNLVVTLYYVNDEPKIREIERISHVGSRIYCDNGSIPSKTRKVGRYVLTTSSGLMDAGAARKKGLGGEIIMRIW